MYRKHNACAIVAIVFEINKNVFVTLKEVCKIEILDTVLKCRRDKFANIS